MGNNSFKPWEKLLLLTVLVIVLFGSQHIMFAPEGEIKKAKIKEISHCVGRFCSVTVISFNKIYTNVEFRRSSKHSKFPKPNEECSLQNANYINKKMTGIEYVCR